MLYVIMYFMILNVFTCILYGSDKLRARKGKWRIPEKVLLGCVFWGGSVGALVGMQAFRHKTRHVKFQILVPFFLIVHIAFVMYIYINCFA